MSLDQKPNQPTICSYHCHHSVIGATNSTTHDTYWMYSTFATEYAVATKTTRGCVYVNMTTVEVM